MVAGLKEGVLSYHLFEGVVIEVVLSVGGII